MYIGASGIVEEVTACNVILDEIILDVDEMDENRGLKVEILKKREEILVSSRKNILGMSLVVRRFSFYQKVILPKMTEVDVEEEG